MKLPARVALALLLLQAGSTLGLPADFNPDPNIFYVDNGNCRSAVGPFSIIVHGWMEGCSNTTEWVAPLMSNLTGYHGGCVICMDYSQYSKSSDYFGVLVPKFELVVQNLLWKLESLEAQGFHPAHGLVFGFSFGAEASIEAGRRFGPNKLGRIDVCDPAGPGFDSNATFAALNPRLAAHNVQCIHTSSDKGTVRRECHQDWNMGDCGHYQVAAGPYPKGSHGLCPYFYTSAFANVFAAVTKPESCSSERVANRWPSLFRMGYFLNVAAGVTGNLFAMTTKEPPYN